MPEASDLVESVVRQLVETVEPNTRFDRTSLPVAAEETGSFRVSGTHKYGVSFRIEQQNGQGPLPAGIRDVGNQGGP